MNWTVPCHCGLILMVLVSTVVGRLGANPDHASFYRLVAQLMAKYSTEGAEITYIDYQG